MREIALHLLDIAENSVAAQARNITIQVGEDLVADRLVASVQDDGKGMDPETLARVTDPFVTSRTTRKVGLGIPLFKAAAEACNGYLKIDSWIGKGTYLEVAFQRSHIDRMPLGDLAGTLLTLIVAYPKIHWVFEYWAIISNGLSGSVGRRIFTFDNGPIQEVLGDLPLTEPGILEYLRTNLENGVAGMADAIAEAEQINHGQLAGRFS